MYYKNHCTVKRISFYTIHTKKTKNCQKDNFLVILRPTCFFEKDTGIAVELKNNFYFFTL